MPDLTADSTADSPPPAVAIPPIIDPDHFEDFPAFRESFLVLFTEPEHNAALRTIGALVFEMALEYRRYWPDQPEGSLRSELRAAVGDLRHAQGNLSLLGNEEHASALTPLEIHHARVAARVADKVRDAADALEAELGTWRGEEE